MASDIESSDDEVLRPQALLVSPIPSNFDPTRTPASAEEYLHHVVWEASRCQDTVTVKVSSDRLKRPTNLVKKQVKAAAPQGFTPTLETQQELMATFSNLRTHIAAIRASGKIPKPPITLPGIKKREEWCQLCFGNGFQLSLLEKANQGTSQPPLVEGQQPLLSILLNIKQQGLQNLLEWHAQWLEVLEFSEAQGRWFYAILACMEKPLTPESCSHIRHVARMCARIRSTLPSVDHPHLSQLNVIICIVARYFCQEDLADQ
ncbi:hypothetical protein Pcinc_015524 [Petrolisthes cinctipes]|uniref:Gem-associated protein 2 n=1 Tax=Petrolisthes cinctipes TaxID=88211 RepID=A0AAE1FVK6_PETCI|nr:hypothetical protein Pcinc_015524 [Petrolisthes cinctipes]